MSKTFASAKFEGVTQLQRQLRELPKRVAKKVTRNAVNAGARIVSRDAKRLARRGATKLLAKSIGVKGKQSKQGFYAKIGARRGYATEVNGRKYDPVRIVHLIEKGTKPHQIRMRGMVGKKARVIKHPGSRAYPFIKPALDNNLGQVQATMRNKLWAGIQEEAKKT